MTLCSIKIGWKLLEVACPTWEVRPPPGKSPGACTRERTGGPYKNLGLLWALPVKLESYFQTSSCKSWLNGLQALNFRKTLAKHRSPRSLTARTRIQFEPDCSKSSFEKGRKTVLHMLSQGPQTRQPWSVLGSMNYIHMSISTSTSTSVSISTACLMCALFGCVVGSVLSFMILWGRRATLPLSDTLREETAPAVEPSASPLPPPGGRARAQTWPQGMTAETRRAQNDDVADPYIIFAYSLISCLLELSWHTSSKNQSRGGGQHAMILTKCRDVVGILWQEPRPKESWVCRGPDIAHEETSMHRGIIPSPPEQPASWRTSTPPVGLIPYPILGTQMYDSRIW